jgi:hypothetical protein
MAHEALVTQRLILRSKSAKPAPWSVHIFGYETVICALAFT